MIWTGLYAYPNTHLTNVGSTPTTSTNCHINIDVFIHLFSAARLRYGGYIIMCILCVWSWCAVLRFVVGLCRTVFVCVRKPEDQAQLKTIGGTGPSKWISSIFILRRSILFAHVIQKKTPHCCGALSPGMSYVTLRAACLQELRNKYPNKFGCSVSQCPKRCAEHHKKIILRRSYNFLCL